MKTSTPKSQLAYTLFPIGYAEGPSFCNRDDERQRLKDNILSGTHTYISGMRLYGKTSLIRQVAMELGRRRSPRVHAFSIDLMTVHSLETLEALLRDAIGRLSAQFLPRNRKVLDALGKAFRSFRPELTIHQDGVSVKLFSESVSAKTVAELLIALDQAAQHYKRRAVLIFDEFQNIAQIEHSETIEESIRLAAKESKALSFVFLGSERSTLKMMFEGENRPLRNSQSYHLVLDRISAEHYADFLQDASKLRWGKRLETSAIERILENTDRHTHYVNLLCRELWKQSKRPNADTVAKTWENLLFVTKSQAQVLVSALTRQQRLALGAIAREKTSSPTATDYLARHRIAGSTMQRSLELLLQRDFLRKDKDGTYEVVDPLVKGVMSGRGSTEAL